MIEIKKKRCKGTGSAKGSGCEEVKYPHRYGLCSSCFKKWLLATKEGAKYLNKVTLKTRATTQKAKETLEEHKKEINHKKTLSRELSNTKTIVHKYIRLRDKKKRCVSCGEIWNSTFQAGHFYKAELYSSLRFDFNNIHGQCVGCNIRKEGNLNAYAINLPHRIGFDDFDALNERANTYRKTNFKWDVEVLNEIKKEAAKLFKELKK